MLYGCWFAVECTELQRVVTRVCYVIFSVICPAVDCPSSKMSQSSRADEGTTFENLWSTLWVNLHAFTVYVDILVTIHLHNLFSLFLWITGHKIQTQYGNAFTWPYVCLWFTYLLSVLLQRARQHIFWASSGRTLGGQCGFQQPAQQPRWSLHGRLPHERHERQRHGKKPVQIYKHLIHSQ